MRTKILLMAVLVTAVTALGIYNTESHSWDAVAAESTLPPDYWPEPMAVYPGANLIPFSRDMNLGRDNALRMAWFTTQDEPLAVARFYEDRWTTSGYFVNKDINPYGGRISSVDPRTGVLRQVTMSREGDMTTVFVSMLLGTPREVDRTPEDIPVYPGAEGVISFSSNDVLTASDVVTFMDAGTVEDNVRFYKNRLAQHSYSLKRETERKGVHMLVFSRGSEEITVSIIWDSSLKMSKVHVARIKGKGE